MVAQSQGGRHHSIKPDDGRTIDRVPIMLSAENCPIHGSARLARSVIGSLSWWDPTPRGLWKSLRCARCNIAAPR